MIRRVLSIVFYVIAGFFFYMVSLLAFIDGTAMGIDSGGALGAKWLPIAIFGAPALLALVVGLAIMGFQNWRRDTGIVFLSAAGLTTFLIVSFASMLRNEEFVKMMPPEALKVFGDYVTGIAVLVVLLAGGALLVMTNRQRPGTVAS